MSEDQKIIFDSIYTQVRSGFYSIEDIQNNILDEIDDTGCADEVSEEWAFEQIDNVFNDLQQESKSWNENSFTSKLINAFDDLAKAKIIAIHYPGFTEEDGEYEAEEVERTLNDNDTKSVGYCFYNGYDLENAISGNGLNIHFRKLNNNSDVVAKEVATKVIQILNNNGLETTWDNKASSPIVIPNFKWEKIYNEDDRDLLNYNDVIDIILENK